MNTPEIDVGPGYRLLKEGERIQEGDEFWSESCNSWQVSYPIGTKIHSNSLPHRRKIEGWIKFSDREPRPEEYPIWIHPDRRETGDGRISNVGMVYCSSPSCRATHWMPAQVPAPPPVEDPIEVAYNRWCKDYSDCGVTGSIFFKAFKAGIEYQKQQKQCQEK